MGFGLHIGWSIEGAIGSDLKIDATYLSPHVEMSDRLEASSKIFKAKLNISHWLHQLASPNIQNYTRCHAFIRAEGVSCPFRIYTFDVTNNLKSFGNTTSRLGEKKALTLPNFDQPDYAEVQKDLHPSFMPTFTRGFQDFVKGDWPAAKVALDNAILLKPQDGPACYTLDFMRKRKGLAPEDWTGSHFLEEF